MKKILAILLAACMTLAFAAACSTEDAPPAATDAPPPAATEAPPEPPPVDTTTPEPPPPETKFLDTLVHQVGAQAFSLLNPINPGSNAAPNHWIFMMIFDRLVEVDYSTFEVTPSLATSWDVSPDYTTYTFTLRDDVVFHNGDKFTAQDVADTIEVFTARPPNFIEDNSGEGISPMGSNARNIWTPVREVNILGDYEVQLVLGESNMDFLPSLGNSAAMIMNMNAVKDNQMMGARIGTGAYKVTDFTPSDTAVFERNDDYWGTMPVTQTQIWRFTPEAAARTVMMQNKEAHIGQRVNPTDVISIFKDDPEYNVISNLLGGGFGIFFNMDDPIAGDINFRKAVAAAIQREPIAYMLEGGPDGAIVETTGSCWGLYSAFRDSSIAIEPNDIEQAKAYLADSSYNGEEIGLIAGTFDLVRIAGIVQEQLREVGINVRIDEMEIMPANNAMAAGEGQMAIMMGQMAPSASSSAGVYLPEGGSNYMRYNNEEVTALITEAMTATTDADRERLYKEAQAIISEDMPCIMIFYRVNMVTTVAEFGGVIPPVDSGMWDLRNAYVVDNG